jgi:hypothetical protein
MNPQPCCVHQKANGNWTFDIFPNGIKREAGEFPTQEAAEKDLLVALRHWEVNGQDYGNISVIKNQGPIIVA